MSFAPQIRDSIITRGTGASATPVINLPATVAAGDTLLVVFRSAVAGAVGWPSADWNELWDASDDAADDQFAAAWKKADGTEGGTTITLSSGSGKFAACAWAIRDAADPTTRAPEFSTVATGTVGAQPNATTVTPTGGAKAYLLLTLYSMEGEQTGVTTYPTGYTDGQIWADSGTGGAVTTNVTVAGAGKRLATPAASDDAGAWTVAGTLDDWSAYTVAFHPVALSERIRITDALSAEIPVSAIEASVSETVKVSDSPLVATRTPLEASLTEAIKIDDVGQGIAQLWSVLHITDGPVVGVLNPLQASASESVKVSDSATATIPEGDLVAVVASESLRVLEDPANGAQRFDVEVVRISDVLTATMSLAADLTASLTETIKVDDVGQGVAQLWGVLHITDGPVVAQLLSAGDLVATLSESVRVIEDPANAAQRLDVEIVRVSDVLTAQMVLSTDLVASLSETIKVDDVGQGIAHLWGVLHITDGPVVAQLLTNDLTVSLAETVRVSDTAVTVSPLDISAVVAAESVRVNDVTDNWAALEEVPELVHVTDGPVLAQLVAGGAGDLVAALSESIKVDDVGQGVAQLWGVLHITDGPVVAFLEGGDLARSLSETLHISEALTVRQLYLAAVVSETLHIADSSGSDNWAELSTPELVRVADGPVLAQLVGPSDLSATVASETVRITDSVTAAISLAIALQESVAISESAQARLSPLQASVAESVRVSESLAAFIGLAASRQEAIRISESVQATLTPLQASVTESLRVSDTATARLNPLVAVLSEAVRVSDGPAVGASGLSAALSETVHVSDTPVDLLLNPVRASVSDTVKVQDAVTAVMALMLLTRSVTESVRIVETLAAVLSPLEAALSESIRIVETQVAAGSGLAAFLAEPLHISDELVAVLNPERAAASETLHVRDLVTARLSHFEAVLSETVRIADPVIAAPAAPVISSRLGRLRRGPESRLDALVVVDSALGSLEQP